MSFIVKKTLSRLACVQATYQWLYNDKALKPKDYMQNVFDFFKSFQFADAKNEDQMEMKLQKTFAHELINLVEMHYEEIIKDYSLAIDDLNIDTLEVLTQASIIVGGIELKFMKDKHPNIIIDEFTQIAHMLLTYKGQNLVNLVLDKLSKYYDSLK
jgi:transcription termination factor NusB